MCLYVNKLENKTISHTNSQKKKIINVYKEYISEITTLMLKQKEN